jgi:O-antigen/teichoic acid export membrane protein
MNKKIFYFTLATIFSQLFAFGTLFLYTSVLEPSLYAIVAVFEVILFFIQASVGLALDRSAQRFYVDYDGGYIIALTSSAVILLTLFIFVLVTLLSYGIPFLEYIEVSYYQFCAIYIAAVGYILHAVVLVKYQFEEKAMLYFFTSVAKTASFFLLSYIMLNYYEPSPTAFIYSSLITGIVLIFMSLVINKPRMFGNKHLTLFKEMLRYSIPFVPTLVASWVLLWSNRLFMVGVVEANDIGIFSAAQRVGMIFFVFVQAVSLVATPVLYKKLKEGQLAESNRLMNTYFGLFFLTASLIVFYLPRVLTQILGSEYENIGFFISVIMFANFITAIMGISTNILFNFYKQTLLQMKVFLSCAAIALALNTLLIPMFKLDAVLFNMVFMVLVLFCSHLYLCKRSTNFSLSYIRLLLLIVGFASVCYFENRLNYLVENTIVVMGVEAIICILIVFFTCRTFIKEETC